MREPRPTEPLRRNGQDLTIVGARCLACGTAVYPTVATCPGCRAEMAPADLAPSGTIYSYATVHAGADAPYTLAYVDLDDGVRLLGRVDGDVAIDDRVSLTDSQGETLVFARRP